ncbi:MAG: hypothetical protein QOH09_978, partial [Pseudonocardiales bacterium]|nr:hypothetical protein [Pseudonocardiales bacterium]
MLAWLAARATSLAMLRTATIPKNAKTTAKPMAISYGLFVPNARRAW